MRESEWKLRVALRESEIVAVGPPSVRWLGLAADIGTTKIAAYLMDMETGKMLGSRGLMNPQISYGEDVVSRIFAAGKSAENAAKLQTLVVDALNRTAAEMCAEIHAVPIGHRRSGCRREYSHPSPVSAAAGQPVGIVPVCSGSPVGD